MSKPQDKSSPIPIPEKTIPNKPRSLEEEKIIADLEKVAEEIASEICHKCFKKMAKSDNGVIHLISTICGCK